MKFTIQFHGPFRAGTGESGRGADDTIDPSDPLPATSIKGAMRAAAIGIGIDKTLVAEVFGKEADASPWAWTSGRGWTWAGGGTDPTPEQRIRIRINEDTGTVEEGGLFNVEALWPEKCEFVVDRIGFIAPSRTVVHEAVLRSAGRAVHSLGADRTRGLGWVTVTADDDTTVRADLEALEML